MAVSCKYTAQKKAYVFFWLLLAYVNNYDK